MNSLYSSSSFSKDNNRKGKCPRRKNMERIQEKIASINLEKLTFEKKLGYENAKKVLKAFEKDSQHFGFLNVSEKELAELTSMRNPQMMNNRRDVFSFRAGCWVILIVVIDYYIEVSIVNPYDLDEHFTISI